MRLLYVTTPETHAAALARKLVTDKLAACVNIIPNMTSFFMWDGELEQAAEAVLIVKTQEHKVDKVIEAIVELHPYETPAIMVLPVEHGHEPFLTWVGETVDA